MADSIFDADGAMGTFIGVVGTVVGVLGTLLGIVGTVAVAFGKTAALKGALIAAGKLLVGALAAVVAAVGAVPLAIAAVVVGLAVLIFMFREEIVEAISVGLSALSDFIDDAVDWFTDLASRLSEWASDLASSAVEWGRNIIDGIIEGIRSGLSRLRSVLNDVPGANLAGIGSAGASSAIGSGQQAVSRLAGGSNGDSSINLDGRRLTEDTGRYSFDESARRFSL